MTDSDNRAAEQARHKLDAIVKLWQRYRTAPDTNDGCIARDVAEEEAREWPLSVLVRDGWRSPGDDSEAEEYEILLCTGGPAVRIVGGFNRHGEPDSAVIESQDWFTPWREYDDTTAAEREALLWFAGLFYYGEG